MARIIEVREIPLADLVIGKGQVRLRDVGKEIDELADSISKIGLLEPIVVAPADEAGKYEIITGQRRYLAHQELKKPTILSAILAEAVTVTEAKVISVTENLIRSDLNTKDLIDACTELYKKYGSIGAVAEETGLPLNKVSQYVKYEQLIPELKELVDDGRVNMQVALRAQRAAAVSGAIQSEEAVELATEMASMSGAQQTKIVKEREENPDLPAAQAIEHAKSGGKITQVIVTLTTDAHASLTEFARLSGTTMDDAARQLITDGLAGRGFLEE